MVLMWAGTTLRPGTGSRQRRRVLSRPAATTDRPRAAEDQHHLAM